MKIIDYLKKIIKVNNDDLSFLQVGDIIWAKRYQNEEDKKKLKEGHRESPYVIIKKEKNKVYALQTTSNPHLEVEWKMLYYFLGHLKYNMKKNSYVSCLNVYELSKIQFVEMIGHLNSYDLNQLQKQLYILINSSFKIKPLLQKEDLKFKIGIGDVISIDDKRYYIYDIKNREFLVYRLRNHIKKRISIIINNTYYSFIFEYPEKIKIKSKYELVDTFNTGEVEKINDYRLEYLKKQKEKKISKRTLKIGLIIEYENNVYYIYDLDDDWVYVYMIFFDNKFKNKVASILVDSGIFKTHFNINKISRENLTKNGYKPRRLATEEEIEYNDKIFHLPKDKRKEEMKKLYEANKFNVKRDIDDFKPMVVLKNENNNEYYLIIDRKENIIEVVNINNLGDSFYFELEKKCPFKYYRILSKEEYDEYLLKIKELKEITLMFNKLN